MGLSLVAIALAGASTYRKGLAALFGLRLNMNALMSVAVTGAFLIGEWPEAAMVMVLYALAEAIEARALDRARNAIKSLMAMAPDRTEVQTAEGGWQTVPVADVAVGACVRVRPGERIPLDGLIRVGQSAINQAPVTGESVPVPKVPDLDQYVADRVTAFQKLADTFDRLFEQFLSLRLSPENWKKEAAAWRRWAKGSRGAE